MKITIMEKCDVYGYDEVKEAFDIRESSFKYKIKRFFRRLLRMFSQEC